MGSFVQGSLLEEEPNQMVFDELKCEDTEEHKTADRSHLQEENKLIDDNNDEIRSLEMQYMGPDG